MHGTLFAELEKFVEAHHPAGTWSVLKAHAGLEGRSWEVLESYPDDELLALVRAASEATGMPEGDLVEAFGRFIAPDLVKMYWGLIEKDWRTLSILEHTENHIRRVVRIDHPDASPPELHAERVADGEVVLTYTSPRRMCRLAVGIGRGLAAHFGETLEIEQPSCLQRGDDACVIHFRRVAG